MREFKVAINALQQDCKAKFLALQIKAVDSTWLCT